MKVIIAGGRKYYLTEMDEAWLDMLHKKHGFTEVVCGMAKGADSGGMVWAESRGVPVKRFPADWNKDGLAAGPKRNARMVAYGDALIAFPGGRGTADVICKAHKAGLVIIER